MLCWAYGTFYTVACVGSSDPATVTMRLLIIRLWVCHRINSNTGYGHDFAITASYAGVMAGCLPSRVQHR